MTETPGSPELFMAELKVDDWPGLVRWYAETLGLRITLRDDAGGFALFETGGGRLALKRGATPGAAPADVRGRTRLVFRVDDVDDARRRLVAKGVDVAGPFENAREHYREVRLADPEGTPITLFNGTAGGPKHPDGS